MDLAKNNDRMVNCLIFGLNLSKVFNTKIKCSQGFQHTLVENHEVMVEVVWYKANTRVHVHVIHDIKR